VMVLVMRGDDDAAAVVEGRDSPSVGSSIAPSRLYVERRPAQENYEEVQYIYPALGHAVSRYLSHFRLAPLRPSGALGLYLYE
jgi:hypothetical protein